MEPGTSISLLEGVILVDSGPETVTVEPPPTAPRPRLTFQGVSASLRSALTILQQCGDTFGINALILQTDGVAGLVRWNQYLGRLRGCAMLRHHVRYNGEPLISLRPVATACRFDPLKVKPDQAYLLSRFAYCRVDRGRWLLESPRGFAVIEVESPLALRLLHELARPQTSATLAAAGEVPVEAARLFLNLLANAEAVVPDESGQPSPEVSDPALAQWDFHDLLFHTRCRLGRHDNPSGGTYPFKDKFAPLPVVKPSGSGERIPLARPDLERLQREDLPFTKVLETRASLRDPGDPPINLVHLGEFLYRSARVKKMVESAGVSWRPSPAGGALHELEIYPLVHRCEGLAAGLYHYNPLEHHLEAVADFNRDIHLLMELARITSQLEQLPQVLLLIAARFQRIQLKYQSVSYSVILKNVGALYQTMYLVATAMNLSPCGLGGGHADLFAHAAGLNYYAETTVGEFLLSSRPTSA